MKLNLHPSTYPSSSAPAANQGYHNMTQTLTMLHDEDPMFSRMVQNQHFERGQVVATPDDLAKKDVCPDEWQS